MFPIDLNLPFDIVLDNAVGHFCSVVSDEKKQQRLQYCQQVLQCDQKQWSLSSTKSRIPCVPRPSLVVTSSLYRSSGCARQTESSVVPDPNYQIGVRRVALDSNLAFNSLTLLMKQVVVAYKKEIVETMKMTLRMPCRQNSLNCGKEAQKSTSAFIQQTLFELDLSDMDDDSDDDYHDRNVYSQFP